MGEMLQSSDALILKICNLAANYINAICSVNVWIAARVYTVYRYLWDVRRYSNSSEIV